MRPEGLIDLNEAVQHPGTALTYELDTDLEGEQDLDLVESVTGVLEAHSTGNTLVLKGEYKSKCKMDCARCGEQLEQEVKFKMSDEFDVEGTPAAYGAGGHAKVVDEVDLPLFEENSLKCDAYLRQGLLLSMPAQPLCEFGWEGDCPNAKDELYESESQGHPSMQKLQGLITPEEDE